MSLLLFEEKIMIGKNILHYTISEELGRGGMGVVYLAEDTRLKRKVAIKFLPANVSSSEEERERFKIEAQAAAALNHPNIATIHAIEEHNNEMFIVMEYIEGKELRDIVGSQHAVTLPINKIIDITTQIASGLQAAHEKGIVHRDIKSNNIMVTGNRQVKIMDFGLAKMGEDHRVTAPGTTLGTTAFMAPELIRGQTADKRSDIWAFGVVLYELLTGELPFFGDYEQAVLYSITQEEPAPVCSLRKEISADLEEVVNKCLCKDPEQRYQSCSEILSDLRNLEAPGVLDSPTVKKQPSAGKIRGLLPNPRLALIFSVALIVIILAGIFGPPLWNKIFVPKQKHLAVLPFTNIGSGASRQAFCDGLVETITGKLSSLENLHGSLWVVPASEVLQNKIASPGEAHKYFGVNLAVAGSLQPVGNQFRLTLALIDAANLRQLNSAVIDVDTTKISSLQEESVIRLLRMLKLEFKSEEQKFLNAGGTTSNDAYELYVRGRGYLQHYEEPENIDRAIDLFQDAIEKDSLYALARAGLGEAYWRKYLVVKNTRLVTEAVQASEKAFRLNGNLVPVNVTLGIIHAGTGRYEDAVADFNRALNIDPTNASAYRGLAKAYESLGRTSEAEQIYQRAIKLKPDYWAGYNALGLFYYRNSQYRQAAAQFRRVITLTPQNPKGYNSLGGMYYMMKRYSDARKTYEQALALKKTYRLYSNLGTLFFIEGKYSEAAHMYEEALKLNDRNYSTWGNLAAAYYWVKGKREKAKGNYWRAISMAEQQRKINKRDPDVISSLAGYYASVGEKEKALSDIKESLQLASKDARVMYRSGTSYELLGDRDNALYWIGKALENGYSLSEIERQPEIREMILDKRFQNLVKNMSKKKSGGENPE